MFCLSPTQSILLRMGEWMIHLVRGKHPTINNVTLTEDRYDSPAVTIARAGLFIIVSAHEHGLEMMWDRGGSTY